MAEFDNTNRGVLFRAKEKKTDKHPDYTGSINVGGKDYYLSAWLKDSKAGQKYFSMAVTEKREAAPTGTTSQGTFPGPDSQGPDVGDIPF
jgi:hypothetical protein